MRRANTHSYKFMNLIPNEKSVIYDDVVRTF